MGKDRNAASQGKMGGSRIFGLKEKLPAAGLALAASGFIAFLFYDSPWGLCSLPLSYLLVARLLKERKERRLRQRLDLEFKDYLYAVNGLLLAGYSVERAFVGGLKDVGQLHGEEGVLAGLLGNMERRLNLQEPIETILRDFAEAGKSEDIRNFVEIFCYAKRGGGDFVHIIATTVGRVCDKMEVSEEIRTAVAQKALEQKVMCAVPLGILLFFKVTSPEFIGRLYGSLFGAMIMTAALVLYAAAFVLGMKIVEIEV